MNYKTNRAYDNFLLLIVLRKLRDEGIADESAGLCANIANTRTASGPQYNLTTHFLSIANLWPLKVVDAGFPVNGSQEFAQAKLTGTLWNNPRRHELLHWMIMYLENYPNE